MESYSTKNGNSDHNSLSLTWSKKHIKEPKIGHTTITYRSKAKFNEENFLHDLNNSELSIVYQYSHPDQALNMWLELFRKVYNKHAPIITKRVKDTLADPEPSTRQDNASWRRIHEPTPMWYKLYPLWLRHRDVTDGTINQAEDRSATGTRVEAMRRQSGSLRAEVQGHGDEDE